MKLSDTYKAVPLLLSIACGPKSQDQGGLTFPSDAVVSAHNDKGAKKTVIVLPDLHLFPGNKSNPVNQKVQDFHVEVVKGLAHLHPGIVVENVPRQASERDMLNNQLSGKPLLEPYRSSLLTILEEFPDEVQVYGSIDGPSEWPLMLEYAKPVYDKMVFLVNNMDESSCEDNSGNSVPFDHLVTRFQAGIAAPFEVDCYCQAWESTNTYLPAYQNDRKVLAPRREANAAFSATEAIVIVISGINHEPELLRQFEQANVNYWSLKPKGIAMEPKPIVHPLKDDAQGTCEKWKAAN